MTIYVYHKQGNSYPVIKCDFEPLKFHNRIETVVANKRTENDAANYVESLNVIEAKKITK